MRSILSIKILGICALMLAACTTSTPFFDEPENVSEMQTMQAHFHRAQTITTKSWPIKPTTNDLYGTLTWQFNPYKGVSLNVPNGLVDIQPSNNGFITIKSFNDPQVKLEAILIEDTLNITIKPVLGGKVILYLPPQTKYLILRNMAQVNSLEITPLYLNIVNSNNVHMQASNWMLEYLYLSWVKKVNLDGIATPYLLTWLNRANTVNISGSMSLRELDALNSGPVNMYQISSPILTVKASGESNIFLAGRSTVSNVKLQDSSAFDSRYMPSERLFIKTTGTAQAQVRATQELNAFADEWSLIGYYNQPTTLSRYYNKSGSILYLGDTVPDCTIPYCPVMPRILPG